MPTAQPYQIKTISEFHQLRGLPSPEHPQISLIDVTPIRNVPDGAPPTWFMDFYMISMKRTFSGKIKMTYGQQQYDFDEGLMTFMAPGQILSITLGKGEEWIQSGWVLLIHPDFLWNTSLAAKIREYEFFDYSVHEALFLSEKEEATVNGLAQTIRQEYQSNIDRFSQDIIIGQMESLLTYADRFYHRQFITRKVANHAILHRLEALLTKYFNSGDLVSKGQPTVKYVSTELNISPNYLSGLLKVLSGKSTQQHIQDRVIELAKQKLSTTNLSVSEIAFELGFDYPQSFSKLFKVKTNLSPLAFRKAFN